ncbi:hypothetical protein IKI14_03040 [bacterium]|nr:hypothetical protein [bacterium]
MRYAVNSMGNENLDDRMKTAKTYQERAEYYASQMDNRNLTQYYNFDLDRKFKDMMDTTFDEYLQSEETAAAADIISLFSKIR